MALTKELDTVFTLVNEQAEDGGLWFDARTAPEAYLQQELRRLHEAIEECDFPQPLDPMSGECPKCAYPDFADPETQNFVAVKSGTQPGTPHGAAVHWAEGWIVCAQCGHTEWADVRSD